MRIYLLLALTYAASGCTTTECGMGTIERNGTCEPADSAINPGTCGPNTTLQGDKCVPTIVCDPMTTTPKMNPDGSITCVGTGGGKLDCSQHMPCPQPSGSTKQTICGQLYDFEDMSKFADAGADGSQCPSTPTASGPCSLGIQAYDAIAFGTDPTMAQPLPNDGVYIDNCGRYKVTNIVVPSGPFIGLGIDDPANMGPMGTTITVGIATGKSGGNATDNLEGYIVKPTTAGSWASTGGPTLQTGYYIPVYRAHSSVTDMTPQAGVTFTKSGSPDTADDYYFAASEVKHLTVDTNATATGANGTALIVGAAVKDSIAYSGQGGFTDTTNCRWEQKAGATLPGIAFIQIFRPTNQLGKTCPL